MVGEELAKTALAHINSFGTSWNMLSSSSSSAFVVDHGNQKSDRSGKEVVLTCKQSTVSVSFIWF